MPLKTLLPTLAILFITTSACGPLVPLSYVKERVDNQLVQTIETEEATVLLQFIETKYNHYVFDLEIINHSQYELPFAPQWISYYASPKLFPEVNNDMDDVHKLSAPNSSLIMQRQFAGSPAAIKKMYREKVKGEQGASIFLAILAAGLIVYDAAKDSDDSNKERWSKKDVQKSMGRDMLVMTALATSDIANASAQREQENNHYLPYELFPECVMAPNAAVRGKIFVPLETSYRFTRIVVPVGNTDYIFDFKRMGVKTTRSQSPHHPSADGQHK